MPWKSTVTNRPARIEREQPRLRPKPARKSRDARRLAGVHGTVKVPIKGEKPAKPRVAPRKKVPLGKVHGRVKVPIRDTTPGHVIHRILIGPDDKRYRKASAAAELEGTGRIAAAAHAAGRFVGKSPLRFGVAPLQAANLASLVPGVGKYPRKLVERTVQDAFDLPAQAIPSLYVPGKKAVEGHPGEAGRLLAEPFVRTARNPAKEFSEHPLATALLVAGGKGAAGRGAGAALRRSPSKKLRKAGSIARKPRTLEGTSLTQRREYSPDIITKAAQVAQEKLATRKVGKLREKAKGMPEDQARALEAKAVLRDPQRMRPSEVRRRVDERVDANFLVSRANRGQTLKEMKQTGVHKAPVVGLVAQGITKASKDDLRAYMAELERVYPELSDAQKVANRALRKQIKGALKSRKFNPQRVQAAADAYRQAVEPLERKLIGTGMLSAAQAEKAKLIPYATRRMGSKDFTPEQIREHMATTGTREPAFATQAPNMRGARNFYVSSERPPSLGRAKRTGEATRKGTFDASGGALVEQGVRMRGLIDAHEGFQGTVGEFAHRSPTGKVKTLGSYRRARQLADELNAKPGSPGWTPVRINPFAGRQEQLEGLLERIDPETVLEHKDVREALTAAVEHPEAGPGPWALIPTDAAQRLQQHMRVLGAGGGAKAGQLVNKAFRTTVLATSPKWLTGNVVEGVGRTALLRATPADLVRGRRVVKRLERLDERAAKETAARALGGAHYSFAARAPRRGAEQFEHTSLQPVARALGAFWRAPGPRQLATTWRVFTDLVFRQVNQRGVEVPLQTAMAGKYIRTRLMDGNALKLSERAIEQAAQGLRNTDTQVAMARYVDRAYGRYSKFSPDGRKAIALYTPFVAWSLNAVRFVTSVLPRDHPAVTALIASAYEASEEWRKEHGLSQFIEGAVPGWLQGSIPTPGGGHLRVSRYTPFGAFGEPGATVADAVLPQLSGTLEALKGRDWTGRELPGSPDQAQRFALAAKTFLEATVPVVGQAERITKNEGSLGQKLRKEYDPFKAVKPRPKKGPQLPDLPELPKLPKLP